MFFDSCLRVAGNVCNLVESSVIRVAALRLRPAALAHALDVERVGELQQPILPLGQCA